MVQSQAASLPLSNLIIGRPAVLAGRYLSSKPKYTLAPANEPSTSFKFNKDHNYLLISCCVNYQYKYCMVGIYHHILSLLASPNLPMTVLAALADPLLRAPP